MVAQARVRVTGVARFLHRAWAWLFVLAVLVQVYLAGVAIFGDRDFSTHEQVGYMVHATPVLLLVLAGLARAGWRIFGLDLLLAVLAVFVLLAPLSMLGGSASAKALHPVVAVLLALLGTHIARRSFPERPAPAATASGNDD